MATISQIMRLCSGRQMGAILMKNDKMGMLALVRPITIKAEPAKPRVVMDHDDKNMGLKRPMSPHLTIYAQELQSFCSITHRMTGVALALYTIGFGAGSLMCGDGGLSHAIDYLYCYDIPNWLFTSAKMMITFPFVYHYINGARHLVWDMGKLLTIKEVLSTGYIVLGLSLAASVGLALI